MARGKSLYWDVTLVLICPLADSYVSGAAREAGLAAELMPLARRMKKALRETQTLRARWL